MSNAQSRIVGIEYAVAGFAEVGEEELRRKLGRASWHVWQVLCARRNRQGLTHITQIGIGRAKGFVEMAPRTVEYGLVRLRAAGLVENVGWTVMMVPKGDKKIECEVYVRRVRGARQLSVAGCEKVSVPAATKEWMKTAKSHGGARMGAGRRSGDAKGSRRNSSMGNPNSSVGNPRPRRSFSSMGSEVSPISNVVSADSVREEDLLSERTEASTSATSAEHGPSSMEETELPDGSLAFGGCEFRETPPMVSTPLSGLPPYPGDSLIRAAQVPDPPKIAPEDSEEKRVRMLASAYRAAVEKQYGAKCFLLHNVGPRAKSWGTLVKAAAALEAFGIAPAAWCIYAVRRWYLARTHAHGYVEGAPVPLPPIGVAFSIKQINDRLEDEDKRYVVEQCAEGGRLIFGKTHKELIKRYYEMRKAVIWGMSKERALAKYFPNNAFDEMVDTARMEAKEIRAKIEDDIARGRLVW